MDTSTGSKRLSKESKKKLKEEQEQARLETKFGLTDKYDVKGILYDDVGGRYNSCTFSAVNKETREEVVVKKIKVPFQDTGKAMKIVDEIKISIHLWKREFLVEWKDLLVRPDEKETFEYIYLVSEKMDGELRTSLTKKSQLDKTYIAQLLLGLDQIHKAKIIHGDLKPENLLVRKENSILKICDYGESRSTLSKRAFDRTKGSFVYSAPELLLFLDRGIVTTSVDIWAAGCIFAELILGHRLNGKDFFRGKSRKATDNIDQLKNIVAILGIPDDDMMVKTWNGNMLKEFCVHYVPLVKDPPLPLSVKYADEDIQAIDLLEKMLTFDPKNRINVEQAIQHEYIQEIINENIVLKNTIERINPIEEFIHDIDDCLEDQIFDEKILREMIWAEVMKVKLVRCSG